MYSYPSSHTSPRPNDYKKKKQKQPKASKNYFADQFNHIYRNKDRFSSEQLFQSLKSLTIQFIKAALTQKPKKICLEDVICNNLSLGINSKNKNIIFFHIKLAQVYIKAQLNLRNTLAGISCQINYQSLEHQFDRHINLNISLIQNLKEQKLKLLVQKSFCSLFKFISIKQTNNHRNYLNAYLGQSLTIKNFHIFYQIVNNYFQKLVNQSFTTPIIDINSIFNTLFTFQQINLSDNQIKYRQILSHYLKIMDIPIYRPYALIDFQKVFNNMVIFYQKYPNKNNQWFMIYLYNVLIDSAQKGSIIPFQLNQFLISTVSYEHITIKLHYFYQFYIQTFKNPSVKSLTDLNLTNIEGQLRTINQHINILIQTQHNFVRFVDKIIYQIQKIKRNFLKEIFNFDNNNYLLKNYYYNKNNQNVVEIIKKFIQIQTLILLNKNYLAIDNFRNTNYLTTSGIIQIGINIFYIYQKSDNISLKNTIKKWINKIKGLNIEQQHIKIFYRNLYNLIIKKICQTINESQNIHLLLQPFQFILQNTQLSIFFNGNIYSYLQLFIKKMIRLYDNQQQKNNRNKDNQRERLLQKNKYLNGFVSRFCLLIVKYAHQDMEAKRKQNKSSEIDTNIVQIIASVNVLFCLNNSHSQDQDQFKQYVKSFLQLTNGQKFMQNAKKIKHQSKQSLQFHLITFVQKNQEYLNSNQMLFIELVLKFLTRINKIKDYDTNLTKQIYQYLKNIDFLMYLKKSISNTKSSSHVAQYLQNYQNLILGGSKQTLINKLSSIYYSITDLHCPKQNKLQLYLNIITKTVYLICNPQNKIYENLNSIQKNNSSEEINWETNKKEDKQIKTKRQNKEQTKKYYEKCVHNFQSSCMVLAKAKYILVKMFKPVAEIVGSYRTGKGQQNEMEVIQFKQDEMERFDNLFNMIGYTWNLLWLLKLTDQAFQFKELMKLRLGVYDYYTKYYENKNILQFQIDKLKFFGLLQQSLDNKDFKKPTKPSKTNPQLSILHKLLLNTLTKQQFLKIQSKFQSILYTFANSLTLKNFKPIISCISSIIFRYKSITHSKLTQTKIQLIPFIYENYRNKKKIQQNFTYMMKKQAFGLNTNQIIYPFMTLILRKVIFLVKKNNQLSEMRSLLELISGFFSKIGLAIYYDQLVELWLMKNIKINMINIMDCYRQFISSYSSSDQNQSVTTTNSVQQQQKTKILQKIDRMFCNKRRSISTHFTLKIIVDLIKSISQSSFYMKQPISKIILYQFKQQFNLYNYQIYGILNEIYPKTTTSDYHTTDKNLSNFNLSYQSQQLSSSLQQIRTICRQIIFQKQYYKTKSPKVLQQIHQNIKMLNSNLSYWIVQNYKIAQIIQNLIGFFIQQVYQFVEQTQFQHKLGYVLKDIDLVILNVAMCFIEFNYQFKERIYLYEEIQNFNRESFVSIYEKVENNKHVFQTQYKNSFIQSIKTKTKFLLNHGQNNPFQSNKSHFLQHPLSIIYPLRQWVYNISFNQTLLVTKVNMFNFDHSLSKIQQFIEFDSQILIKQKSIQDWWKGRKRLDRQMGKIAQITNLGVFDVKVQQDFKLDNSKYKKYNKLVYCTNSVIRNELQSQFNYGHITAQQKEELEKQILTKNQMLMVQLASQNFKINQNILILTVNRLSVFPFERIKSLQNYHGIYRVPSIKYIMQQQQNRQKSSIHSHSISDVSYAINIHNDLKQTQKYFYQIKQKVSSHLFKQEQKMIQWKGVISQKPSIFNFQQFVKKSIYLYMGHGFGAAHVKEKEFYQMKVKSVCMIFGCSSINMEHQNSQIHGMPLIFLINQCPSLLGALWQVTDKDTDLLTSKIFQMVLQQRNIDFSYCVRQAKKHLKLSNMNGNAIVVYGLPTNLSI